MRKCSIAGRVWKPDNAGPHSDQSLPGFTVLSQLLNPLIFSSAKGNRSPIWLIRILPHWGESRNNDIYLVALPKNNWNKFLPHSLLPSLLASPQALLLRQTYSSLLNSCFFFFFLLVEFLANIWCWPLRDNKRVGFTFMLKSSVLLFTSLQIIPDYSVCMCPEVTVNLSK